MAKAETKLVLPRLYCIVDASCFAATADPTSALVKHVRELLGGGATLIQYRNKQGAPREMLSQAREVRRVVGRWSLVVGEAVGPRPSAAAIHALVEDDVALTSGETSYRAGGGASHARSGRRPTTGGPPPSSYDEDLNEHRQRPTTKNQRPLLIMNDRADLCLAANFDGVHIGQDDLSPEGARSVVGPNRIVGVSTHNIEQVRAADSTDCDYIAIGPVFATSSKQNPGPVIGLEGVRAARAVTNKPLVAIGGITRANCKEVIAAGADSIAVISDLLREPRRALEEFLQLMK